MYSPNSLLRESVTGGELHRRWPSSQAPGLFQNATASQAFAFFIGFGPFPKRIIFIGIRLLHRLWAFLGVEPPEVLDVPCVLDWHPLLSLQARGAGPGNMNNFERALPHGRELVQPLPGENPPEHEVSYLESSGADVAAVISPQCLLVPRRLQRGFSATFLPQHEVHPPHGVLLRLIECQDPRGATSDLVREDSLRSVDEEEWGLAGRLGRCRAD